MTSLVFVLGRRAQRAGPEVRIAPSRAIGVLFILVHIFLCQLGCARW